MSIIGLCHRCEYRASFLDGGARPRYQCGDKGKTVIGCYMYLPVIPLVVSPLKGEKRPVFGPPMIAGRVEPVRVATTKEVKAVAGKVKGGILATWVRR